MRALQARGLYLAVLCIGFIGRAEGQDCSEYGGVGGVSSSGLVACCLGGKGSTGNDSQTICTECAQACSDDDDDDEDQCCVPWVEANGNGTCGGGVKAPCVLNSNDVLTDGDDDSLGDVDEASLAAGAGSDSSSGVVIALVVVLALVLMGNAVCCFMFFKRKSKSPPPAHGQRDPHQDAELGRLQAAQVEERNRRIQAEALINRVRGGGLDAGGEFPSVGDVYQHVRQLVDIAINWTEKASAIGRSHAALPATIESVLRTTFVVCREEVKRSLDERLEHLSLFLGNDEPVVLSGGDAMNLDTQYVLYDILCKGFRKIVPVEPQDMEKLAKAVQQRCVQPEDARLVEHILFGDAWPSFSILLQEYILVFVEMALQDPAMDFQDGQLGQSAVFDPAIHRDWAPYSQEVAGNQCCIVFPTLQQQEGRPPVEGKVGVVRVPA